MFTKTRTSISDSDLKSNVLSELKYEPSVKTSDIGVLVHDGTVTLNGFASSYWEKSNALKAAKRVAGVNGIADSIEVKLPGSLNRTDGDIVSNAAEQLRLAPSIPAETVKAVCREGWVTLEGDVEWWYQKVSAEKAIRYIPGVKGIFNEICIKPKLTAASVESDIHSAFRRSAILDADEVAVTTDGGNVTLNGKVKTHSERVEAERAAWAAPGVKSVKNNLSVKWSLIGA